MFDLEGRILNNKSILMLKAALPYLDIPVGETVDFEGLLRAIRGFCQRKEQHLIDMLLNFFMMKRMMSMMSVMNEMQSSESSMSSMDGMFDILKSQMPKEQQDMFDMMSMMMSAMDMGQTENSADSASKENAGDTSFKSSESEESVMTSEKEQEPEAAEYVSQTPEESPIPEIWRRIAEAQNEGIENDEQE